MLLRRTNSAPRKLRISWEKSCGSNKCIIAEKASNLYTYMGPNQWGDDPHWRPVILELLRVAMYLYLLPPELVEYIRERMSA